MITIKVNIWYSICRIYVFCTIIWVISACSGIADAETGGVFNDQPCIKEAAKLQEPNENKEQDRQDERKFHHGLCSSPYWLGKSLFVVWKCVHQLSPKDNNKAIEKFLWQYFVLFFQRCLKVQN